MPELWVPGAVAPSLEEFVGRLNQHIERFAVERAGGKATVEVELHDGSTYQLEKISAEPGFGFITLSPHPQEGEEPQELIVPVGSIVRLTLGPPVERAHFGFGPPEPKKKGS